jgi:hypothetical protein
MENRNLAGKAFHIDRMMGRAKRDFDEQFAAVRTDDASPQVSAESFYSVLADAWKLHPTPTRVSWQAAT